MTDRTLDNLRRDFNEASLKLLDFEAQIEKQKERIADLEGQIEKRIKDLENQINELEVE